MTPMQEYAKAYAAILRDGLSYTTAKAVEEALAKVLREEPCRHPKRD